MQGLLDRRSSYVRLSSPGVRLGKTLSGSLLSSEPWHLVLSAVLRQKLIDLGTSNPLLTIRPGEDCDLYLAHTVVDAKYYGIASKEQLRKQYAAKMWLVEPERTVKYREIIQEQKQDLGVLPAPKLTFEKSVFKGKVLFQKEKGVAFGFKKPADPGSFGKAYEYDFDVTRIRGPVKELVEANGWKFEQIILDYQPARVQGQRFCGKCGTALPSGAAFCTNCGQKVA